LQIIWQVISRIEAGGGPVSMSCLYTYNINDINTQGGIAEA